MSAGESHPPTTKRRARWVAAGLLLLAAASAGLWAATRRTRGGADGQLDALMDHARSVIQYGRQKDLWRAIDELRPVAAARPNDYEAHLLLAFSLLTVERAAEAEPEFRACARLRPDRPEPLVGQASCAVAGREFARAEGLLGRALVLDPFFVPALVERGNLRMLRQQDGPALDDFERVVRADPRNKQGHLKLAQLCRRRGDPAGAREHERICREIDRQEALRRFEADGRGGPGPGR